MCRQVSDDVNLPNAFGLHCVWVLTVRRADDKVSVMAFLDADAQAYVQGGPYEDASDGVVRLSGRVAVARLAGRNTQLWHAAFALPGESAFYEQSGPAPGPASDREQRVQLAPDDYAPPEFKTVLIWGSHGIWRANVHFSSERSKIPRRDRLRSGRQVEYRSASSIQKSNRGCTVLRGGRTGLNAVDKYTLRMRMKEPPVAPHRPRGYSRHPNGPHGVRDLRKDWLAIPLHRPYIFKDIPAST